jgi:hypothetical protein
MARRVSAPQKTKAVRQVIVEEQQREIQNEPRVVRMHNGRAIPPPGPHNYIIMTPNFLPLRDDEKSEEERR